MNTTPKALDIPQPWRDRLSVRLQELQMSVPADIEQRLLEYIALLLQWNAAYNLTAVREPLAMIDRHLIDSLAILPYAQGGDLADIGTGPGIPGLILALVHPYRRVWLVDSNGKKARFLRECLRRFAVPAAVVHEARAESLSAEAGFDQVISRAYAELADFVASTRQILAPQGRWLALKGKYPDAEIARLPADVEVSAVHRLIVPGADGERHLLELRRSPKPAPEGQSPG
ncbi:MAG: 16S rRNA (guanine(527)-N(7))-methyltransferase RsmG [Lysobacterales bacterium]